MFKKYLYLIATTLLVFLFTACSEDDPSTGSGGSGGSSQSCDYDEDDFNDTTWKLFSESSSASITLNEDASILDSWTPAESPMDLLITLADDSELTATLSYLHVNTNDENIVFFLSEDSYWSVEWGDKFIEITCEVDDYSVCSSFLSYSDGTMHINAPLDLLTSVSWVLSEGVYSLTMNAFTEESTHTPATFSIAEQTTISAGSVLLSTESPFIIETEEVGQNEWNQSYMTFNTDGSITHLNTLDCSLIIPENQYDCYDEGCAPTIDEAESIVGCENIICSDFTNNTDCLDWNACQWIDGTCSDIEEGASPSTWSLDCNKIVLDGISFNLFLDGNSLSISSSLDFCSQYAGGYTGEECYDYTGPAEDFYGLSGYQIDGMVLTNTINFLSDDIPTVTNNNRFVNSPIFRPRILEDLTRK